MLLATDTSAGNGTDSRGAGGDATGTSTATSGDTAPGMVYEELEVGEEQDVSLLHTRGGAVQVDSIKTRGESAPGFSA